MSMTSSDIRKALQSLINLGSALTSAGDIVAAAEEKEAFLKGCYKQEQEILKRIEELRITAAGFQEQHDKAHKDYYLAINDLAGKRAQVEQEIEGVLKLKEAYEAEIADLKNRLADGVKAVDNEVFTYRRSKDEEIAGIDAKAAEHTEALAKAEKAYEQFKKRAGLA